MIRNCELDETILNPIQLPKIIYKVERAHNRLSPRNLAIEYLYFPAPKGQVESICSCC